MSTSIDGVLRGPEAVDASVARFNVDFRADRRGPGELTDRAHARARATGYAEGWSQGVRAAQEAARAVAEQHAASLRGTELARAAEFQRAVGALAAAAGNLERRSTVDIAAVEDAVLS